MESAKIVRQGDGARFPVGPTLITTKLGSELTARMFLAEHQLPAGFAGPPPHTHGEMDHLFYVLSGRARFVANRDEYVAGPGDVAFLPRGILHAFGNAGDEIARILEFNVPGGFDRYYAELAEAFPPGSEVRPAIVQEIMARHGITPT